MTISLKVVVSGAYKATIKHTVDGVEQGSPVTVNGRDGEKNQHGSVEGYVPFQHGVVNGYELVEEYLGDKKSE